MQHKEEINSAIGDIIFLEEILKLLDIKNRKDKRLEIFRKTNKDDNDYIVFTNKETGVSLMCKDYGDLYVITNVFKDTPIEEIEKEIEFRYIPDMIDLLYANKWLYEQLIKKEERNDDTTRNTKD